MKKAATHVGITIVVVGLMIASIIYLMSNSLFTVTRFGTNYLNRVFSYQVTTLALSLVIILVIALLTRFQSLRLLSVMRIDGDCDLFSGVPQRGDSDPYPWKLPADSCICSYQQFR